MSRFTVGQEITPKETCEGLTYGKFYRVCGHLGSLALVSNNIGRNHAIHDDFALTREEYEQAEREKDPFAPGKWVVCVEDGRYAKSGDILRVDSRIGISATFGVEGAIGLWGMMIFFKSHFRPATPEEIYNHLDSELARTPLSERTVKQCVQVHEARRLAKKTKEQEMKIMDEKKADEARANRQTFTVGGREFYVGQSVWCTEECIMLSKGDELEVLGAHPEADRLIAVRKPGTWHVGACDVQYLTTTKPKPHEWKFGDWARHPELGVVFIVAHLKDCDVVMVANAGGWCSVDKSSLTYISTAEIPE